MPLHLAEFGPAQAPSILFLHGGGVGGWSWRPQIEAFQADYHLLVPDLPEHGQSLDVAPFSMNDAAARMAELIHRRAHGGHAHVVGLSLGAQAGGGPLAPGRPPGGRGPPRGALLRPPSGARPLRPPPVPYS